VSAHEATVLVTPRSFARHEPALLEHAREAVGELLFRPGLAADDPERTALLARADGWIAGLEQIDAGVLEAAPRLRVIARYGVGTENVDLPAAHGRGIAVTNTPGANAESVAELTIAFVGALARSLPWASAAVRAGGWPRVEGVAIAGRTLGLLGLGAIGRAVARRAHALGMQVLAHDPALAPETIRSADAEPASAQEVVGRADFLSLHVPVLPETRGMVDARFLGRMKPGAFLINAARGELVDETALAAAVRSGHLAGAALDSLAAEPPPPDHPLLALDSVIVTPHVGAHTDAATTEMGRRALADCLAVLDGRPPRHPVVLPPTEVTL
jgi:D-3-phosphoglycerate dehydrogenase / 2-oxoglutarate reductase